MTKKLLAMIAVAALATGATTSSASATNAGASAKLPPKGARAVVEVSPNPTAKRGEKLTITGHCGGGTGLKAVIGGIQDKSILEEVRILDDNPKRFKATATLRSTIGNGVGPIFVNCGGEMGVTLLVTHV
ncbi:hypothetical protein ABZ897_46905 [Nonomuraea sp. NPDC046802]|uniref:hypothetical protein n=1 Tax=Nonomuraea sp. NPDC046802 TaxID=3154919 RepID=UPI0034016F21